MRAELATRNLFLGGIQTTYVSEAANGGIELRIRDQVITLSPEDWERVMGFIRAVSGATTVQFRESCA